MLKIGFSYLICHACQHYTFYDSISYFDQNTHHLHYSLILFDQTHSLFYQTNINKEKTIKNFDKHI